MLITDVQVLNPSSERNTEHALTVLSRVTSKSFSYLAGKEVEKIILIVL